MNLFNKIVPGESINPSSSVGSNGWKPEKIRYPIEEYKPLNNPIKREPYFSLRDIYMKPSLGSIDITPWYKDTSTLLWILGIGCTIGLTYFGYKIYADPTILTNIWSGSSNNINPDGSPNNSPITINDNRTNPIISSLIAIPNNFVGVVNPFNWFTSASDINTSRELFVSQQNSMQSANFAYYPFTDNNPYDSWFRRFKISWLGESVQDYKIRMFDKKIANSEMNAILNTASSGSSGSTTPIINVLANKPAPLGTLTPLPIWTPKISSVGLGVSNTGLFESTSSYQSLVEKFSSVPSTPTHVPTYLPLLNTEELNNVIPSWIDHVVNKEDLAKQADKIITKPDTVVNTNTEGFRATYAKVAAK